MKTYLKNILPSAAIVIGFSMFVRVYAGTLPPPAVRDADKTIQTLTPALAIIHTKADQIRTVELDPLQAQYAGMQKQVQAAYAVLKQNCYQYNGKTLVHVDNCSF